MEHSKAIITEGQSLLAPSIQKSDIIFRSILNTGSIELVINTIKSVNCQFFMFLTHQLNCLFNGSLKLSIRLERTTETDFDAIFSDDPVNIIL